MTPEQLAQRAAARRILSHGAYVVWSTLLDLNESGIIEITNQQLAELAGVGKNSITAYLNGMVEQGLIARYRQGSAGSYRQFIEAKLPFYDWRDAQTFKNMRVTISRLLKVADGTAQVGQFDPIKVDDSRSRGITRIGQKSQPQNPKTSQNPIPSDRESLATVVNHSTSEDANTNTGFRKGKVRKEPTSETRQPSAAVAAAPPPPPSKKVTSANSRPAMKLITRPTGDLASMRMWSADKKADLVKSKAAADRHKRARLICYTAHLLKERYTRLYREHTGGAWWANGKFDQSFIKAAELILEFKIRIKDWLEFLIEQTKFIKDISFPQPGHLASVKFLETWMVRGERGPSAEEPAGRSYKHLDKYDGDEMFSLMEQAGLKLPPADPPHLRGFIASEVAAAAKGMPHSLGLAHCAHIVLVMCHRDPSAVRTWLAGGIDDSRRIEWSKCVTPVAKADNPVWAPVLQVQADVMGG